MMTKELIKAEIDNINDADLDELHKMIRRFLKTKSQVSTTNAQTEKPKTSGLCGIWEDERTAEEIIEDITSARSQGRDIAL